MLVPKSEQFYFKNLDLTWIFQCNSLASHHNTCVPDGPWEVSKHHEKRRPVNRYPYLSSYERNVDSSIGAVVLYRQVRVYKNVQAFTNLHLNEIIPYHNYRRYHSRYMPFPPPKKKETQTQKHVNLVANLWGIFFFQFVISHKLLNSKSIPWSKITQKLSLIYYRLYCQVALELSFSVLAKLRSYTNIKQFRM